MTFSSDLKKFNKKVETRSARVLRGTALDLFGAIVERTPVGNPDLWESKPPPGYAGGMLRANWQLSVNFPATGKIEDTDKSGRKAGAAATAKSKAAKAGDSIWITNNLPYAMRVENGWSTQAPTGMMKVTIREFNRHVAKNANKEKNK